MKKFSFTIALAAAAVSSSIASAAATWDAFIIRQASSPTTPLTIVGTSDGSSVTSLIDEGGEKTGYGTSFFDGQSLSSVPGVSYTRVDVGTKDPYLNIWITDGTHSAVIAPVANMTSAGGYTSNNVNGLDLQTLGFNIYETDFSDLNWLVPNATRVGQALIANGNVVTVADIGGLTVADPGSYSGFVGTGAPKNGTGFNIIFGDSQGNFVTPVPYQLSNVQVPEPTSLALLGLGGLTLLRRRR